MGTTLTALAISAALAAAPAPRHAVLVGSNGAAPGRQALRFAHRDAQDLAEVLMRTGQFPPAQVRVLLDPTPEEVLARLDEALAASSLAGDSLVLFYYSGHADTEALYPAGRPLPLAALRARLDRAGPAVRVGVVDACRGGGWTQSKGLSREPPLELHPPLSVTGEGTALLASSSGLESAHESEALAGSFFTHHLVAGLRGAADLDGDGEVTLGEAFEYAKAFTVRDTSLQAEAPQHPSFQLQLRGRRDLPLARVEGSPTVVELRQEAGPLQVVQLTTGLVLLELTAGPRSARVAVPPGRYLVRARGPEGVRAREVVVEAGRPAAVGEAALELVPAARLGAKGEEPIACLTYRRQLSERPPESHFWRNFGMGASGTLVGVGLLGMAASGSTSGGGTASGAGATLMVVGAVGLVTLGTQASADRNHDPGPDLEPLADRCDAQLARHCYDLDAAACRGALEAACAGGEAASCWALDPSRPLTPVAPAADQPCPQEPGQEPCLLDRAMERVRRAREGH